MGAGIAAYLAGPLLLYLDEHLALDVALMTASVMVLAYLAGRALDQCRSAAHVAGTRSLGPYDARGGGRAPRQAGWLAIAAGAIVAAGAAIVVGRSGSAELAVLRRSTRELAHFAGR